MRCDASWPEGRRVLKPCLREKPLGRTCVPRTKTDTGGQVENTKVIELTLVKELGKIAP